MDRVLWLSFAALAGGTAVVSPAATWASALVCALLAARSLGGRFTLLSIAVFALSVWRGREAVARYEARWQDARSTLAEPLRCSARARVVTSPTRIDGTLGFVAELEHGDCEGRPLPADTVARLYGGAEDLGSR